MDARYALNDPSKLLSPSLLIFRSLVEQNLQGMIDVAGGADRLRPHVKTHKMAELVKLSERMGVHKHKCATIAEAEMVAQAGGRDVLLAYQLVGPNIDRMARLIRAYPNTVFRSLSDHPDAARALSAGLGGIDQPHSVLIDLEVGMGRTGIQPGEAAEALAHLIQSLPNLKLDGLHAYDGHLQIPDPQERKEAAVPGIQKTLRLRETLQAQGLELPILVMGGTPTFPVHAESREPGVECSPGSCVLHDHGYGSKFPDLPFVPAAVLLSRVISNPRPGRICVDLGHKAVAADPQGPRIRVLNVPDATLGGQSEEHLVIESPEAHRFPPGSLVFSLPTHICPTSALHRRVYVIDNGDLVDEWEVTARDRCIGI